MKRYAFLSDKFNPAATWAEDDEEALSLARNAAQPGRYTQVYELDSADAPMNSGGRFVGVIANSE